MGKVTLVGAGPGDAGLITVKGLEKLRNCDAIIYDRLASEELLQEVRMDCELIYVGKKPGEHSMTQEAINQMLVTYGKKYDEVVRLKGGDSFVFGRGGEEIQALKAAGIAYEVIPGITSAIAVPELAGIPVTHRGVARSFHVITGHTREETVADADYEVLAKLEGTLIFLMGLSHIDEITERLLHYGKSPKTPAAVIAQGTLPQERILRGTLADIAALAAKTRLQSPVVIVIGETTGYDFKMPVSESDKEEIVYESNMLSDYTYGVIATAKTMQEFSCAMQRKVGLQREPELQRNWNAWENNGEKKTEKQKREHTKPIEQINILPLIHMQVSKTSRTGELEAELAQVDVYDWIFFTSKQAVAVFFEIYHKMQLDIRAFAECKFGAIGQGTAKELFEHAIHADFIPQCADAKSFAEEFVAEYSQDAVKRLRVLLPRALQGNRILGEILQEAGIEVREILVYDVAGTCCEHFPKAAQIRNFVFFSASGVRVFFEELDRKGGTIPAGSRCYCIGQKTTAALESAIADETKRCKKQIEIITADIPSVDGMAEKIMEVVSK